MYVRLQTLLKCESYDSFVNRLICYAVNYKTSKSKVYKMYLVKLDLLVKGRSACNAIVWSLIALYFLQVEHFV
jgi:hypothetical protein